MNKRGQNTRIMVYIKDSTGTQNNKKTVKDLRSIALTNATYKLFMGILKTKIEHHIIYINKESEIQAGFTTTPK